MNNDTQQKIAKVARWLETIIDINGDPLILIAETTRGATHRLHIFSDEHINLPTALAILKEALERAIHEQPTIDRLIAPDHG